MSIPGRPAGRLGTRERSRKALASVVLLALYGFLAVWLVATTFMIGWALGLGLSGQEIPIPEEVYDIPEEVRDRLKWSRVPRGWETFTRRQVREHFRCETRDADRTKALPSPADWRLMRTKYATAVDPAARFDDPVPPTVGYTLDEHGPQPSYAKFSKRGGRGLFASRNIEEGEVVHDGDRSDVVFPDGMAWRRYVFSLPRDLACDTTSWNWTQEREDGRFELRSSLNIAILMNSGGSDGSNVKPVSNTATKFVATRNILKDEEILYNYHVYKTDWSAFGL